MSASAPDFEALIEHALTRLPERYRAQLDTVAIVIDDEATPQMLSATGARGLFGLYQGVPRTAYGAGGAPVASKITIFRRPLETFYRDPIERARAVQDTLFHEIAHHFGISDERLGQLVRERRQGQSAKPR